MELIAARRPTLDRWGYLTAVALGLAACVWIVSIEVYQARILAADPAIMTELGRRWLAHGTMYLPYQLTGPYSVAETADLARTPALYPPAAGPLFAPLAFIPWPLLLALWWAIPIGTIVYAVRRWRPARWSWPLIALCLAGPVTPTTFMAGGTSLWTTAAVAAGLLWRWPAVLVVLKPTLGPFALVGVRSRWWWVGAAVIAALTFAGPWQDYIAAVRNVSDSSWAYSLGSVPLMALPLVAWAARTSTSRCSGR